MTQTENAHIHDSVTADILLCRTRFLLKDFPKIVSLQWEQEECQMDIFCLGKTILDWLHTKPQRHEPKIRFSVKIKTQC